jgi:glycosyltransferase involved in cell wall biosynthesis
VAPSPELSIVMTTLNRALDLPRAIECLMRQQTTAAYEIIVVDNGSTDSTPEFLREAQTRWPDRLRLAAEPQRGASHGRNRGIALARAPLIAFTDDDVWASGDWVETMVRVAREHPEADCIGGKVLPASTAGWPEWLTRDHWGPLALVDYGDEGFYVDPDRPVCLITANVAYRRRTLDRIGRFSAEFVRCEDHELLLRLWRHGGVGWYAPELIVRTEVPGERLTFEYHRRWHAVKAIYCARMDPLTREKGGALFGTAATHYRELFGALGGLIASYAGGTRAERFLCETRMRYFIRYIRERFKRWRSHDFRAAGARA